MELSNRLKNQNKIELEFEISLGGTDITTKYSLLKEQSSLEYVDCVSGYIISFFVEGVNYFDFVFKDGDSIPFPNAQKIGQVINKGEKFSENNVKSLYSDEKRFVKLVLAYEPIIAEINKKIINIMFIVLFILIILLIIKFIVK